MKSSSRLGTAFFRSRKQLIEEANSIRAQLTSHQIPVEEVPAKVTALSSLYLEILHDLHKSLRALCEKSRRPNTLQEHEKFIDHESAIHKLLMIVTTYMQHGRHGLTESDYEELTHSRLSGANTLQVMIDFESEKQLYLNAIKEYLIHLKHDLQTQNWQVGVFDHNRNALISEHEDTPPLAPWHWTDGVPKDLLKIAAIMVRELDDLNEGALLKRLSSVMKVFFNVQQSIWRHKETNQYYRDNIKYLLSLNFKLEAVSATDRLELEIRH